MSKEAIAAVAVWLAVFGGACTSTSTPEPETDFVATCRDAATSADADQIWPPDYAVDLVREANETEADYTMTESDIADCHQGIDQARGGCSYTPDSFGTPEYEDYVDCVEAHRGGDDAGGEQ